MGNIIGTTGEVFMWSWYSLRHGNGAVAISKHFFFFLRCILGYLGELSQYLHFPLTGPNAKIAGLGCWTYGCSLCHPVTFSILDFFFFTEEILREQARSRSHSFTGRSVCRSASPFGQGSPRGRSRGRFTGGPGQADSSGLK